MVQNRKTGAVPIAVDFLKDKEAFSPTPYRDSANVWTIGYGSTWLMDGTKVTAYTPAITEQKAEMLLAYHIGREVLPYLAKLRNWGRLNANQQAACISMAYNIGAPAFVKESQVAKDIEAWNIDRVPADMMNWIYTTVDGKKVRSNGLVNRRRAEGALFTTPMTIGA